MLQKRQRLSYSILSENRNILMGIAILAIIIFHFTEDCRLYNVNYSGWVEKYNYYVSSSFVDVFLVLSGFGLYYSFKKRPDKAYFYKHHIIRVLIPYILVALPAYFWRDVIFLDLGKKRFLKDFLFLNFFTGDDIWFWYILMIIFCYLVFPYISKMFDDAKSESAESVYMINCFTFLTVICMMFEIYNKPLFGSLNIALLRMWGFVFGTLIGKYSYENRKISNAAYIIMICTFFALPVRECNRIVMVRYMVAFFGIALTFAFAIILHYLMICKSKIDYQLRFTDV